MRACRPAHGGNTALKVRPGRSKWLYEVLVRDVLSEGAQRRVLIADDDRVTRARLAFLLRKHGYEVTLAESGTEAWEAYQRAPAAIVITDWMMPGMDGPELCAHIRAMGAEPYSYIILLTGQTEKAKIATGLEAGADDYVTKPFDSGELLARLSVGRRILDLQARMAASERRVRELASRDVLTDALNRRALEEALESAYEYYVRRGPPLSLAMVDVDHFKRVNDTYGHQAGDAVLREVSRRISANIRQYDVLGRYGGEEFLIIFPDTPSNDALFVAQRVRSLIAARPVHCKNVDIDVSVSIGLATAEASFTGSIGRLIEAADAALYRAKRSGRNRVVSSAVVERDELVFRSTADILTAEQLVV